MKSTNSSQKKEYLVLKKRNDQADKIFVKKDLQQVIAEAVTKGLSPLKTVSEAEE